MKYIRTKDGRIYEVIEETENGFELRGSFEKKMKCNCLMIKKGLDGSETKYTQADTIEELCDEFLLENKKTHWKGHMPYHKSTIYDEALQRDYIVYGAIWTDKGLIDVAKMNKKGELELL